MELLTTLTLSSLPPIQNLTFLLPSNPRLPKFHNAKQHSSKQNLFTSSLKIRDTHSPFLFKNHNSIHKTSSSLKITPPHSPNPQENQLLILKNSSSFIQNLKLQFPLLIPSLFSVPFPCFATDTPTIPNELQASDRINLESILISIDDFFNRYPFFVAGVTFIWLVVIPLTEEYLKKCKFVSANDAYRKLQNDPNSELLDIRDKGNLLYLNSPNLKILNKETIQIQFSEGEEEGFLEKVLKNFSDPANTVICVIDNFDGNSMKVAELLFKSGFKEAYAIKGGIRGKNGWQEIQETLLPPSMHVFPKKGNRTKQPEINGGLNNPTEDNGKAPSSFIAPASTSSVETVYTDSKEPPTKINLGSSRSSSPYPNYPDLKPPSSPAPSEPLT